MLKKDRNENRDQGIALVIDPFLAFVLYGITANLFCFRLWPAVYWKICVHFNLLGRLTGREFLNTSSKVVFSGSVMPLFFFFSAAYNSTGKGAAQQRREPFPTYPRLVRILNNSRGLTALPGLADMLCAPYGPGERWK